MIRVGLIGYGGISGKHQKGYESLGDKAGLVAVCDIEPESFTRKIKINLGDDGKAADGGFHRYTQLEDMLANEQLDMLDICLPTPLHAPTAVSLLRRGYHVLCEKPMARTYEQCCEMLAASRESGKRLMIGQCLRFFPEYVFLKDSISDGRFGKPVSAFFQRLSPPPLWGWQNWYMDSDMSGGCIQDMHVHDIDMARYLFGEPDHVSCRSKNGFGMWDMANSVLCFGELTATVIGDWSLKNVRFSASYRVCFERATVIYEGGRVTVYPYDGESYSPELTGPNGYTGEIEYFVDMLIDNTENTKNPPDSAARSIRLVELLRESAGLGGKQLLFSKNGGAV